MSNYRVRQVLALGAMPDRQLRLLIALATWMDDEQRTIRVGFETIAGDMGTSVDTARRARRDVSAAGKISYIPGRGRGHLTTWTISCLPGKGVQRSATLSGAVKGGQPAAEKGGNGPEKRVHIPAADQHRGEQGLDLRADPSSTARANGAGAPRGWRKPCDRDGPGKHTDACRSGDGPLCKWSWCECQCHARTAARR